MLGNILGRKPSRICRVAAYLNMALHQTARTFAAHPPVIGAAGELVVYSPKKYLLPKRKHLILILCE